jgi:chemotaxis protein histidine kinase CheA
MGALLSDVPCISGATIMGDGKVALILDTGHIIEETFSKRMKAHSATQ